MSALLPVLPQSQFTYNKLKSECPDLKRKGEETRHKREHSRKDTNMNRRDSTRSQNSNKVAIQPDKQQKTGKKTTSERWSPRRERKQTGPKRPPAPIKKGKTEKSHR